MAVDLNIHHSFVTTTRGLRRDILPMILFERAKKLGTWNPADIDFSKDIEDWKALSPEQRSYCMRLSSRFISGEEAVTLDLLPLIKTISEQGHLEEEMFLTTFLWEEAKHIDFFSRALQSYGVHPLELEQYHSESYRELFYDTLPTRMNVLYQNPSPENLVRASATYNLGIEGILAEAGYFSWYSLMDSNEILPGTRQGIRNIQLDESRHIAYGVFLLSRLIAEDESLFSIIEEVMEEMLLYLERSGEESRELYGEIPFDFDYSQVADFGKSQYRRRMARIEKAKGKSLEQIYGSGKALLDEEDR